MIRVALHGATGRMGRAIASIVASDDAMAVTAAFALATDAGIGQDVGVLAGGEAIGVMVGELGSIAADVAIDFTSSAGTRAVAVACEAVTTPLVCGTTGLDAEADAALESLAECAPVLHAPNMSVGVTLLFHLAELATSRLGAEFDAEIVEMHHRQKVDAPSGTAMRLAEHVARARGLDPEKVVVHGRSGHVGPRPADQIGVMSLRGGGVVGEHTLYLASDGERLELTHRAMDRSIFARGAVRAAKWIVGQSPGRYGMSDVLGL